ncbi:MAG: hypothetical protein KME27_20710 [Lyngbya sp. HA4199-MV5]|jgi:hypothetical protein|nr:hypothetical protein [Lyngbya sp. HA4199-MV5]
MNTTKNHYDQQLASVYSWMAGTPEGAIKRNQDLFRQLRIDSIARGLAIDLGAGSGFQSMTCFLEYHENTVEVYDLLHRKDGEQWVLSVSSYPKLRVARIWVCDQLQKAGLQVIQNEMINGMICLVAQKRS